MSETSTSPAGPTPIDGCPVTGASDADPPTYPFDNPTALDPPPQWAQLRDECPVAPITLASGDRALLLTRYDDVKAMLSDARFTRDLIAEDAAQVGVTDGGAFNRPSRDGDEQAEPEQAPAMMVGPGHQRWRRLIGRSFTVKRVRALQPRIREIADELITGMLRDGAPADLKTALSFPLPVYVICELLGVPHDDHDKFAFWSDTLLNMTRYQQSEVDAAGKEFTRYMADHVAAKQADPGDDLLSELAAVVHAEDGRMTAQELIVTGQGLLIAGHETTANMISKMMAMLLSRRDRWERLLADPDLVATTVEEALRFDANPGFGMPRYVSERTELGGVVVEPGSTVVSSMASANRDGRTFDDPDEMNLDRSPNPHLAFGVGPHSCVGQTLARIELQTVLTALIERMPGLELALDGAELQRREGLLVGGLEAVPVRW